MQFSAPHLINLNVLTGQVTGQIQHQFIQSRKRFEIAEWQAAVKHSIDWMIAKGG